MEINFIMIFTCSVPGRFSTIGLFAVSLSCLSQGHFDVVMDSFFSFLTGSSLVETARMIEVVVGDFDDMQDGM